MTWMSSATSFTLHCSIRLFSQVKHGFDYAKDYFPDLLTNRSVSFLRESKASHPDQPLLMVVSYPGPHGPEDSAPQYKDLFFNVTTHQ